MMRRMDLDMTRHPPTYPGSERVSQRTLLQHKLILSKLGPMPGRTLGAMDGYGLNDREIGVYFGVSSASVRRLRKALCARDTVKVRKQDPKALS